jgi:hypothetical protein
MLYVTWTYIFNGITLGLFHNPAPLDESHVKSGCFAKGKNGTPKLN